MATNIIRVGRCAMAISLCWMASGCGEAPSAPALESTANVAAVAPSSPQPKSPAPLTLATRPQPVVAESPVTPDIAPAAPSSAEVAAPVAEYQPPFPDRVDLFVAPKREGGARAHGDSEESVELLGFVEVDEPQAVLSINGLATPIAAGEIENGIEVISIQPPMVLLQRGRQRWQATLAN